MNSIRNNAICVIILCMLIACSSNFDGVGTEVVNSDSLKYGIVYNGCGPTDAPVVRIILTDEEFSCEDSHRNVKHIVSYLEIGTVKEIKIGMVISGHASSLGGEPDPAYECEKDFKNCVDIGVISIKILDDDGGRLEGTWELESSNRSGNFNVKKCDRDRGLCG